MHRAPRPKRHPEPLMLALLAALAAEWPAPAQAQSRDDLARADALFNAGKALTDGGQYSDACPKFAESKRLAPGLGVTLYLADCYEHIGRTASAWTEFRTAEGLARERNDKRVEVARDRARALEPTLDRLTIAVDPIVPRNGLQVLRDGTAIPMDELGVSIPVDPGDHVVVVSSPGHKARVFESRVGPEARTATVLVQSFDDASPVEEPSPPMPNGPATPLEPVTLPASPPPAPLAPAEAVPINDRSSRRWIALGIGGVGVAGVAIGAVFGLAAKAKRDQSNAGPCDATNHCDASGLALRKDAAQAAMGSNIGLAIGGVALATGLVIYLTAPGARRTPNVTVVAAPLLGGGAGALRASF